MARKDELSNKIDLNVATAIDRLRLASGLSRKDLADAIGVTHQQCQKYLKGTNRISAGRLYRIAVALSKPVDFFFSEVDNGSAELPTVHKRMAIEVSNGFMAIRNPAHQSAVNILVRALKENA